MALIHPDQIGGGRVERTFSYGGRRLVRGDMLTREQIVAMPAANRNALIETKHLLVWPPGIGGGEKFVQALGFGRYNVIQGRKLNDAPIDRETAHRLAGLPPPEEKSTTN